MAEDRDDVPAVSRAGAGRPCPICGRPASGDLRPFCSKRCADVDLHRWLGGRYVVPAGPADQATDPEDDDGRG